MSFIFGGGSSKTTTIVQPAPASAEEIALQQKQLELATFQLSELQRQSELQASFVSSLDPLIRQQAADADRARERADALFSITNCTTGLVPVTCVALSFIVER